MQVKPRKEDLQIMKYLYLLTTEENVSNKIEKALAQGGEVMVYTYTDSLDLIDHFLHRFAPLVILDIDLVKEDVIKLMQIIRSIRKDVKFLLILSVENMHVCSAALAQGVVSYQIKPLSIENLIHVIHSTLNHS
ncbi:MAG: hypothetical protein Kow0042_05590 [Calditrichia bacterium]